MKIIPVLIVAILLGNPFPAVSQEKQVVGLLEKVKICPENLIMTAKLDTGAEHSSLSATNIEEFERNGMCWIRFDVHTTQGVWGTREKRLVIKYCFGFRASDLGPFGNRQEINRLCRPHPPYKRTPGHPGADGIVHNQSRLF